MYARAASRQAARVLFESWCCKSAHIDRTRIVSTRHRSQRRRHFSSSPPWMLVALRSRTACSCSWSTARSHAAPLSRHIPSSGRSNSKQNENRPIAQYVHAQKHKYGALATGRQTDQDTIAAVVTGGNSGSVAIIRLSGPDAVSISSTVFRLGSPERPSQASEPFSPSSHRIYYGHIVNSSGSTVDEVLLLPMLRPRSYTCEDVIELHCHGGSVSAQRVLDLCLAAGCRLANAGEFTLRAFLNGRLDLSQAESIAQLVAARTVSAADSALAGLKGGIADEVRGLRARLVDLLAEIEARIDFDDEVPAIDSAKLSADVAAVQAALEAALATSRRGRVLRTGIQVAIVGRPNVGKSSLLNALCGNERAIVTDIPGTTRDIVDAQVDIRGIPVTLLDTAGIRQTEDTVEAVGVERSKAAAAAADVLVFVYDAEARWTTQDAELFQAIWPDPPTGNEPPMDAPCILVANKRDRVDEVNLKALPVYCHRRFDSMIAASAVTKVNLDAVENAVETAALAGQVHEGKGRAWAVNERQAGALVAAHESLLHVSESISEGLPLDFWTIDMRAAIQELGTVTGDDVTEEILDTVFSKFCIGK